MRPYCLTGGILAQLSFALLLHAVPQPNDVGKIAIDVGVPGLQAVYAKGGEVQHYTYGKRQQKEDAVVDEQTIFQAASLSKVVAAYAFLKLHDKGVFDLDTPLSEYFEYDRLSEEPRGNAITGRMVLNHTSGLRNWQVNARKPEWRSSKLELQFTPGERFLYSGEAFYYLQATLEHITGKSLQQIAKEEVFEPLGMSRSAFVWQEMFDANAATGHREDGSPYNRNRFRDGNSAYTLLTTAADFTQFIQKGLINGEGLKPETFAAMTEISAPVPSKQNPGQNDEHIAAGLGVRLQFNEAGKALWHTGSNTGFRCFFITYPEQKESLVVFTNSNSGRKTMQELIPLFFGNDQTFWLLQ